MQEFATGKFHSKRPSRFTSLDHLVGAGEHCRRNVDAERLRGLEIDHHLEFGRCLNRKISWLLSLENSVDVAGSEPIWLGLIDAVGDQSAFGNKAAEGIHSGQAMLRNRGHNRITLGLLHAASGHDDPTVSSACKSRDGFLRLAGVAT